MRTIHKYPVKLNAVPGDPRISIEMPKGAQLLTVQTQHADTCDEMPYLWAIVDTTQPKERRYFTVHGTGHELRFMAGPPSLNHTHYVGSFQLENGRFMFHLFTA